ncbi:hypothetical protein AAG906_009108 [Vitis piasezkii]
MGGIPPIIGTLGYLKALSLHGNNLNDSFSMEGLCKLNLEELDLSYNGFEGSLPACLNNLTSLRLLDLSGNDFRGTIPPSLLQSEVTRVLNLSGNALQGNIPSSMGDMEQLGSLDLSNNNLSGQLPEHMMMGCISLEVLKLSNNSLHDTLPTKSNLTRLSSLSLDNNDFWGEISHGFLNSSSLLLLDVSSNSLMGQIPDWIGDFSALRHLSCLEIIWMVLCQQAFANSMNYAF